jgi:hypothetical protein
MSDPLSGVANTVTDTVSASMKSFTDFLQNGAAKLAASSGIVAQFVHPSALVLLYVLLFVHFVAWVLENNGNLESKWPAFAQSMHELRTTLQTFVLGSSGTFDQGLVYWGSFAISATVSSQTSTVTEDVMYALYLCVFYALVFIINQVCMAALMKVDTTVGSTDGGPMFPAFPGSKAPLVNPGKGKPFWLIFTWLQNVTALVLFNSLRGVTYGYGAGKIVGLLTGNPTSF